MAVTIFCNIETSKLAVGSLLTAALLAFVACAPSDGFTDEDKLAVRALEEAYRTGWLANDSAAVMATLAPGVVLMPAGVPPLIGDSAIRDYWWPSDGSQTTVHSYEITVEEVEGNGDLAYLRGRGSLFFTYRDAAGDETQLTSEAVHLSVAHRSEGGTWRIARRAWSRVPK
ncbi:MAG: nuclear transport factor 2 family protein [Gemmatimonadetes bacterium]|nr:nuclear transport factor 2 family protein [Gemmatimonadota bacterium]